VAQHSLQAIARGLSMKKAFLSYQTKDKATAALVSKLLADFEIESFMAHEHIEVSAEWRQEILRQIGLADLFVPILSANYYVSIWCKQESGIAAFRGLPVIPLSIDGAIPEGFLSHIQSAKIDANAPLRGDLLPGLAKFDITGLIDAIVKIIAKSSSFQGAESNFELVLPYLPNASVKQIVELLLVSAENNQVCNAGACANKYLPPLFKSHGHLLNPDVQKVLADTLARDAAVAPPPKYRLRKYE
jgi:TIR domain